MSANVFAAERTTLCPKYFLSLIPLACSFIVYLILYCLYAPSYRTLNLKSIHGETSIVFDSSYGIPYIFGSTNQAAVFGLGYVHARDRLYELELHRLMAWGHMSTVFGEDTLNFDKHIRSLQFLQIIDKEVKKLSNEHFSLLQAYTDGINEYVNQIKVYPIEFIILGMKLEVWTVKDTLMIFKLFSFSFSEHWKLTALRSILAFKLGREMAERIVPFEDITEGVLKQVTTINSEDIHWTTKRINKEVILSKETIFDNREITYKMIKEFLHRSKFNWRGSSAWVIHRFIADNTLLGNINIGVHSIPSEIYIVSIKYPYGPELIGSTIVGIPFIISGRNNNVAWGITTSYIENIDIYSIKLNSNHTMYFYEGEWKSLKISNEIIEVKGSSKINYTTYRTHHGPIISQPSLEEYF